MNKDNNKKYRTQNNLTKGKSKLISIQTDKISQQPENCEKRNDPDLVQAFLKKWWVESDFKASNRPLSLRLNVSGCHYNLTIRNPFFSTPLLEEIFYQRNHYRNHKLQNVITTEIYIYTTYASAAEMLLYINGRLTILKLKSYFVEKSFSDPTLIVNFYEYVKV